MFGRATITLGIGPHSSNTNNYVCVVFVAGHAAVDKSNAAESEMHRLEHISKMFATVFQRSLKSNKLSIATTDLGK